MKPALTLFLFLFTCSWTPCISAQSVKISNKEGKAVGEFETQVFINSEGRLKEIDGLGGNADFSNKVKGKVLFRIKNLHWFDDDLEKKSLEFRKSEIRVRKDMGMEVSSNGSKFRLSPNDNEELDIYFDIVENGNYRIEFPFTAGKLEGRMSRAINVSGLPDKKPADLGIAKTDALESSAKSSSSISSASKEDDSDDNLSSSSKSIDQKKNQQKEQSTLTEDDEDFELTPGNASYDIQWLPENIVEITTTNFPNPIIETLSHPEEIEPLSNTNGVIMLRVRGSKAYFIKIRGDEGLLVVDFDNSLKVNVTEDASDINFEIKGGISPYAIQFLKGDETVSTASERYENLIKDERDNIRFTYETLSTQLDGNYTHAIISDATAESQVEVPLNLVIVKETGNTTLIIGGLLAMVVAGGFMFFIAGRRKKKKREEYQRKAHLLQREEAAKKAVEQLPAQEQELENQGIEEGSTAAKKISIQKTKPQRTPLEFGYRDRSPTTSGNMKIKWRDNKFGELEAAAFMSLMESRKAVKLNLEEHWADSMVDCVFLSHECIHDLGSFLKKENLSKMQSELQGAIPEVGGFLMGNHSVNPEGNMHIFIDKFVPFVPEYHDVFKIEIGTQTLVQELGDAQDRHPDMDLIGWFHTHPGHGLFLSNSDLSVHKHFSQPFQVAMEIDSLTDRLDTAFFTRKRTGRMNNVEHRNEGAIWFAWKEIEKSEI
jgi:proteasome lid subunit RPN8/RPN11